MSAAVVLRGGPVSVRVERRTLVLTGVLLLVIAGLALLGLCHGATWASPAKVFDALTGGRGGVVIRDWRLPRVLAGLVFGAALGVAGAIFQNITRNPMGSPDVIGLDAGAYTGALVAITVLSGTSAQLATGSVVGGALAALAVYLLSLGGGLSGLRLVVIGIAVNAMLTALNSWIVLRAELEIAIAAVGWSAGSLNGVDWADVRLPFGLIAVLLALAAACSHALHQDALGTSLAVTTGVGVQRLRLHLVLIGVGLTAAVTAVAGPIAFIALAAPQIGRRLARSPGVPLLPAALTGAVLLQGADLLAQLLLAPVPLPVGVVSTAIGGCYLIWLLTKEVRRR
ncbi:FecCD family ABC transporter permease [Saccharothrix algeriensis]|uniref:Iron chelate uptake ABC transporter family permease subunit n=1 Tax=Saccharothrix algeriensis TaxID=173560 RepID=A0A8T8HXQ9_9PSEU|nr:iron chelate uptake ABC transporter family permease subunit [Saccharothrix algeriensis]MBM7815114.1 iron complex transport system permease protein [Saccharothrix algeriensis]QTR03365.1 iron chelate uptake ABC transporter family permease subunit [Saccharothrix algeriensis]